MALGASVALHLLIAAILPRTRGPTAPLPPPSAVYLIPTPATVPVPPAPFTPPVRSAVAPRPAQHPVVAAQHDAAAPPAVFPGDAAVPSDLRSPGIARHDGRGTPPDLQVHWSDLPAVAGPAPAEAGPARAGDLSIGDWLREKAGRARVESGAVHPYYQDLGRTLLKAWDAEGAIVRHGLAGRLAELGDNLRTFGRVWQQMAEGYGRTGSPGLVDGDSERVRQIAGLPAGPARETLMAAETERQLRPAFSQGQVALVRITQAATGQLLSVELVTPSSDAALDRAAVDGVRAAAERLPPPPDEVAGTGRSLVSLWEFEIEISITPPLPVVAVEFDEVLGGLRDVRLPLDRRVRKHVRLVSVYDLRPAKAS